MAVSRPTGHRQTGLRARLLAQLTWYDLLLAVIPLAFAVPLLGAVFFPIPLHVALATGAVTAGLLVADALFVHTPTPDSS